MGRSYFYADCGEFDDRKQQLICSEELRLSIANSSYAPEAELSNAAVTVTHTHKPLTISLTIKVSGTKDLNLLKTEEAAEKAARSILQVAAGSAFLVGRIDFGEGIIAQAALNINNPDVINASASQIEIVLEQDLTNNQISEEVKLQLQHLFLEGANAPRL